MLGVGLPPGIVSAHFHSALPPQTHPTSMSKCQHCTKKLPTKTPPPAWTPIWMVPLQQCKVFFRIPHCMKYTRNAMPLKMLSVSCLFGPGHPSESVILYSAHWALKPSPLIVFTMVTNCSLLALFSSLVSRLCLVTVLQDIKKLWPIWLLILFIGLVLWIMKPGVFDFCWANSFSCMIWQTWKKTKSHSDSHYVLYLFWNLIIIGSKQETPEVWEANIETSRHEICPNMRKCKLSGKENI